MLLNVYRIAQRIADTDTSHIVAILTISIEEKEKPHALSPWWFALCGICVVILGAGSVPGRGGLSHPTLLLWHGQEFLAHGLLLTELWHQVDLDSDPAPPSSCAPAPSGEPPPFLELRKVYNPLCLAEFL